MEYVQIGETAVPKIGLGTWQLAGRDCEQAVEQAIGLGYRHVDTAEIYENEAEVGTAIARAGVDREELFLTTKVWIDNLSRERMLDSVERSLERLRTGYVDLLLVHWPTDATPLRETIDGLGDVLAHNFAKHVGVSNFTPSLIEQVAGELPPLFCNQIEYHPFLPQHDHLELARRYDYMVTAYSPLARGQVTEDETLAAIGRAHDKSAVQVALRWLTQQEPVAAIPRSSKLEHLYANLDVFDFQLQPDEMRQIGELAEARDQRLVNPEFAPAWRT